jgi:thiamine pyrophosphokinase
LRAVIFANGWFNQLPELRSDDILIAADGGARLCLDLGLQPAIVIGDFDSLNSEDLAALKAAGSEIIQYPARKDFTDLELALRHTQSLAVDEILVLAALGARWDQTMANLLLPVAFTSTPITLIDGKQEIRMARNSEKLTLQGRPGDTVSLIPLAGDARGVTTQNLEYPLEMETLLFGSSRGVSNVMLKENASVTLQEGVLFVVVIHESPQEERS